MADREEDAQDPAGTVQLDPGTVDNLVQLSFLIQEILGHAAARHALSITQLRLLGVLRGRQPGMQELARHLKLDKSSVTGLIDRAEQRGLVQRSTTPQDGRVIRVSSTALGQQLAAQGAAEISRQVAGILRALPGQDQTRLSELAGAVVQHALGRAPS
jgi:DNA-binding MarR family transcriptional regulator